MKKQKLFLRLGALLFVVFTAFSMQVKQNYSIDNSFSSLELMELAVMAQSGGEDTYFCECNCVPCPEEDFGCFWYSAWAGCDNAYDYCPPSDCGGYGSGWIEQNVLDCGGGPCFAS